MKEGRIEGPVVELECVFCGLTESLRLFRHYHPWPPTNLDDYFYFKEHAFDGVENLEKAAVCADCSKKGLSLEMYGVANTTAIPIYEDEQQVSETN